mmetsp:Transcript_230/g.734  ORF Transcript_230/g.734 Transcript_230/m.734 type:complete len:80 (+) Transcript_230:233-472(+)|eukprot:29242-Pelagococcus_subviridis.AAC.4
MAATRRGTRSTRDAIRVGDIARGRRRRADGGLPTSEARGTRFRAFRRARSLAGFSSLPSLRASVRASEPSARSRDEARK